MDTGFILSAIYAAALAGMGDSPEFVPRLVPQPVSLQRLDGFFTVGPATRVVVQDASGEARGVAEYLAGVMRPAMGYPLPVSSTQGTETLDDAIVLSRLPGDDGLGEEGYRLVVDRGRAAIEASTPAGLFYGAQTLRQLLPVEHFSSTPVDGVHWRVPCLAIEDYPRFVWRGACLDVARHFMPKDVLEKFIDALALHKMNVLHLHLTDDQGWRIEIKGYPKLTRVGAWRSETLVGHAREKPHTFDGEPHGGFYTQDEIRGLVQYAASRHVTLVPEIEMPGHAQAAIAAYPELGNTGAQLPVHTTWGVNENIFNPEESTILFLQDVLAEVLELFPSRYIHVGGDEAVKKQWENSEVAQARIRELGLKDETELQSYFIRRMDSFLASHGRRLIGWDEILEGGLAAGATVMSWRGDKGGIAAAQAGHDVVMAPTTHTYFDYYQSGPDDEPLAIGGNLPLEKVYSFDPVPGVLTREEARHILGAQGQLWTEYIKTPGHLEYMAFPRLCALAEVVWTPQDAREYEAFLERLRVHLDRLDLLGINYRNLES